MLGSPCWFAGLGLAGLDLFLAYSPDSEGLFVNYDPLDTLALFYLQRLGQRRRTDEVELAVSFAPLDDLNF